MPDIPVLHPRQPWDLEDKEDRGRSRGSASSQIASRQAQRTGTSSSHEPYGDFDQFAAQQERNGEWLIDLDPTASASFHTNTNAANRHRPVAKPSLLDLDIDDAMPDEIELEDEEICCEQCGNEDSGIFSCNVCNFCFCARCWDMQIAHKRRKLGPGGIPHEKTPPDVAKKVSRALEPSNDSKVREKLYEDDELTAWFGK
jgi:hypothetical protein